MKTKLLLSIIVLSLLFSCETRTKKSNTKATLGHTTLETPMKPTIEETAHVLGCMTIEEFGELKYTYVIEKNLPCSIYVENFNLDDIVSVITDNKLKPKIEIALHNSIYIHQEEDGWDEESELEDSEYDYYGFSILPDWSGVPSTRSNECWLCCTFDNYPHISGYIGIDNSQSEWIIKKAMESEIGWVKVPIIIRVDQVRKDSDGISIKADLVKILCEN